MNLFGRLHNALLDALLDAYQRHDDLRIMVRIELDENLDAIAGGENLTQVTNNLIRWAEQNGRVLELVKAAQERTPGNLKLKNFVATLEIYRMLLERSWPIDGRDLPLDYQRFIVDRSERLELHDIVEVGSWLKPIVINFDIVDDETPTTSTE